VRLEERDPVGILSNTNKKKGKERRKMPQKLEKRPPEKKDLSFALGGRVSRVSNNARGGRRESWVSAVEGGERTCCGAGERTGRPASLSKGKKGGKGGGKRSNTALSGGEEKPSLQPENEPRKKGGKVLLPQKKGGKKRGGGEGLPPKQPREKKKRKGFQARGGGKGERGAVLRENLLKGGGTSRPARGGGKRVRPF